MQKEHNESHIISATHLPPFFHTLNAHGQCGYWVRSNQGNNSLYSTWHKSWQPDDVKNLHHIVIKKKKKRKMAWSEYWQHRGHRKTWTGLFSCIRNSQYGWSLSKLFRDVQVLPGACMSDNVTIGRRVLWPAVSIADVSNCVRWAGRNRWKWLEEEGRRKKHRRILRDN